jgi:hypothetical protein
MKSISLRYIGPAAVLAGICAAAVVTAVAEQAPGDESASMVKPPQPPASGANAHNPDNMPIHRPKQPTNDPIARPPPASAANAK